MRNRSYKNQAVLFICACAIGKWSVTIALAQGVTCVSGSQVRVCVGWSQSAPPELDLDFIVGFTDPMSPTIGLITGDLGWSVYCETLATPPRTRRYRLDYDRPDDLNRRLRRHDSKARPQRGGKQRRLNPAVRFGLEWLLDGRDRFADRGRPDERRARRG